MQDYGVQLCNNSVAGLTTLSRQQSSFKNVKSAVKNLAGTLGQLVSAATEPPDQENLTISNAVSEQNELVNRVKIRVRVI